MRVLLDTHALLWAAHDADRLPDRTRGVLADPANEVWASAASAWEVAIKRSLGKLVAAPVTTAMLDHLRFRALPVSVDHAAAVEDLPRHHGDPFDRVLVAQALVEDLVFVSRDPALRDYDVPLLWD